MKLYHELVRPKNLNKYLVTSPFCLRLVITFRFFLLIVSLVFLFAKWVPAVSGNGRIVAFNPNDRRQMIEAPIEGRIKKWFVQEGSKVKSGDLIAKMIDIDPLRFERLNIKLQSLNDKLNVLQKQKEHNNLHVERMNKLFSKGIESKRSLELAEIESFKVSAEINKLEVEIQDLKSEISRQASQDVFAPIDGSIMKILAIENSSFVESGDFIAKIIPSNIDLAVELIIRGKDLALLRNGQQVRLAFEGWPAVQIIGWPAITVGTFPGEIKVIDAGDNGDGNFRVLITANSNSPWPTQVIRMGTKVKGWVQMKRVPVWWEIWRLVSGIPPTTV